MGGVDPAGKVEPGFGPLEMDHDQVGLIGVAWRLGATLLLVLLNGFFVSAEFALVKVRRTVVEELAEQGRSSAKVASHILDNLDRYLSGCQLGITVASLILGALGEPAVSALIAELTDVFDIALDPTDPVVRWTSLTIAFTSITILHMTLGEQAPKMWALRNAKSTALQVAYPLKIFTVLLSPLIGVINWISNLMLRAVGMSGEHGHEPIPTSADIRTALALSAEGGQIPEKVRELAENVFRMTEMRVRHILVPRADVVFLDLAEGLEACVEKMRRSGHTRFPLCEGDLDSVIGVIHGKDLFLRNKELTKQELRRLARKAVFVPDSQLLGEFVSDLQQARHHMAIVLGEHGSTRGLAFLEDAIEEVLGPMADEFDEAQSPITHLEDDTYEVKGNIPLPDAIAQLNLELGETRGSTLGGHLTSVLNRLPIRGDELELGPHKFTVTEVTRRRVIGKVRVERMAQANAS